MNIELEKLAKPSTKECRHSSFTFYERGVICDDCDSQLDELSLARALAQELAQVRAKYDLDLAWSKAESAAWFFWAGLALGVLAATAAQLADRLL